MPNKFMQLLLLLCMMAGNSTGQTFSKTYPQFDKGDNLVDLVATSNGYAFIGGMRMVMVDQQGEITKQWNYDDEGGRTYLHKLIGTSTGKFMVLATIAGDNACKLIFMSADGQVESTRTIQSDEKMYSFKLMPTTGSGCYLSYLREVPEKPLRLTVHKLDATGQEIWTRECSEGVLSSYAITPGANGGWEAAYIAPEKQLLKVVRIDEAGDITQQEITPILNLDAWAMPLAFQRTPDGGYLFAGDEVREEWDVNQELHLIKAAANGRLQWQQLLDVQLDDYLVDLHCDANGAYILSNSGSNKNFLDPVNKTDLALTRIDYEGGIVWKKAFGSRQDFDLPSKMLVMQNQLLIGGYGKLQPHIFDAPILIKSTLDGDLQEPHFPHPIQPSDNLHTYQLGVPTKTEELVSAVPMPDGGWLSAIKLIGETENDYAAALIRTNAAGEKLWMQVLNENAIPVSSIRKTNDGNYVVLIINYWMGLRVQELIKFDETGKLLWRKLPVGKTIDDVVPAPDGGYLLTGSVGGGLFDFSALLLKLDAEGNESWRKTYTYPERWVAGTRIAISQDNTVGIMGYSERFFENFSDEIFLLQTDLNGNTERSAIIKKRDSILVGNCILPASDNHFLITGYAQVNHSANKDAFLLKVNRTNDILLNRVYDFGANDEAEVLISLGDTAYCMAGTCGEPKLGNRKMVGFLANIKPDGVNNGIAFIGNRSTALQIRTVVNLPANRLAFAGTWFRQYGTGAPFTAAYDPAVVLSAGGTVNPGNIRLYPNPAKGTVWLTIDNEFSGQVRVSITGINGVVNKKMETRKSGRYFNWPLPVEGLTPGIYLVEITMNNNKVLKRMVILP